MAETKRNFYHLITKDEDVKSSILKDGLKCNDEGNISVFKDPSSVYESIVKTVTENIANNQINDKGYCIFEIDSNGITTELIQDDIADFDSKDKWIIKQPKIEARFITLYCEVEKKSSTKQ